MNNKKDGLSKVRLFCFQIIWHRCFIKQRYWIGVKMCKRHRHQAKKIPFRIGKHILFFFRPLVTSAGASPESPEGDKAGFTIQRWYCLYGNGGVTARG